MSSAEGVYDLRLMRESDIPFIMSTFLKGVYYGNSNNQLVDKRVFMDNYKHFAQVLINNNAVILAVLKDDHDVILGYSIVSSSASTVHWCYVKAPWRNKGIGRALVPSTPKFITHFTHSKDEAPKDGPNKFLKKFVGCIYNPFAIA
jgi:hypothetical protein